MATLKELLRTARLGPISLGMNPFEAESILGEPTNRSRKSNPLELQYGPLRLIFWRHKDQSRPQLMEMSLSLDPACGELPAAVALEDADLSQPLSERAFLSYLHEIQYVPVHLSEGSLGRELVLPSNVVVSIASGSVASLRVSQQKTKETSPSTLSDSREPSREQIDAMLDEARVLLKAGHDRAALLVAWAGLEAVLRRVAIEEGYKGRTQVQASILLRELESAKLIPRDELIWLEAMRQIRTSTAHGLAPEPIDRIFIERLVTFAGFLLRYRENFLQG